MGFLRQLFGPSKDEVWQQLAHEIGAELIDGGFWNGKKVEAQVGAWTITLDTYVVSTGKTTIPYTRLRAPYVNKDGFRFRMYRAGLFSAIGKWMGGQDIAIGDAFFDDAFMIKGTDEEKVRALLARQHIRQLMMMQPDFHLEVKDDEGWFGARFPEGVDELHFQVVGVIKDIERLKALYELFAEILQHLCRIGSAYEDDPQVLLR